MELIRLQKFLIKCVPEIMNFLGVLDNVEHGKSGYKRKYTLASGSRNLNLSQPVQ